MELFRFFYDNFPPLNLIAWLFPVSLLFAFASLFLSGILKKRWQWRTGLTRKSFHFLIFIYVFFIQLHFGLPGTFIVGWAVTALLIYAIRKGEGNLLYESIAREQDAPHRTRYIVFSYLATFGGGVLSNLFFGKLFAVFGYLITGIADAIAEPVGVLFGKHKYRVLNFHRKQAFRSVEGSAAVFLSSFLVLWICGQYFSVLQVDIPRILLCSCICTAMEAFSPQGWDNLILQLAGSFAVYAFLA